MRGHSGPKKCPVWIPSIKCFNRGFTTIGKKMWGPNHLPLIIGAHSIKDNLVCQKISISTLYIYGFHLDCTLESSQRLKWIIFKGCHWMAPTISGWGTNVCTTQEAHLKYIKLTFVLQMLLKIMGSLSISVSKYQVSSFHWPTLTWKHWREFWEL